MKLTSQNSNDISYYEYISYVISNSKYLSQSLMIYDKSFMRTTYVSKKSPDANCLPMPPKHWLKD